METKNAPHTAGNPAARSIDWTPYLVGTGIGVLSWVAFAVAHDPLGVTTAYSRFASLFALPFLGESGVAGNPYWKPMPFAFDYSMIFLVGLVLGSFTSALFKRSLRIELMHNNWRNRFGGSLAKRFTVAFFGGAILMYGARLAGGCTSGHAISGGLQLALSSWVFLIGIFTSGILSAAILFGSKKGERQ